MSIIKVKSRKHKRRKEKVGYAIIGRNSPHGKYKLITIKDTKRKAELWIKEQRARDYQAGEPYIDYKIVETKNSILLIARIFSERFYLLLQLDYKPFA